MIHALMAVAFALSATDQQIVNLEKRVKQQPGDSVAQIDLAGSYLQKMRETADGSYLKRASQIVDKVLAADAKNYDARRRRIEIEMQRHHFADVIVLAKELIAERPRDLIVWGFLGDAYMERGDYDDAPDAYQQMVDLKPSMASYSRVAYYRFVTGDAPGAIDLMRKAIAIGAPSPENVAWCWSDLGKMLLKTGAVDDSEQAYREALKLFPTLHHALAGMGYVKSERGHWQEALEWFGKAQAVAPFPEYTGALARIYDNLGKPGLKRREMDRLDVADTLDRAAGEPANRNLALAFADLDHDTARAVEIARAELAIRHDVYTLDAMAWSLYKNGQLREAGPYMVKALAQSTPEPTFRKHADKILGPGNDPGRGRELCPEMRSCFNETIY